jgi:hypothetical protein
LIDARDEEPISGNVWTLGPEPGRQSLRVQVAGGASAVTFFATATDCLGRLLSRTGRLVAEVVGSIQRPPGRRGGEKRYNRRAKTEQL